MAIKTLKSESVEPTPSPEQWDVDRLEARISELELRLQLFGRAMIVLKGLNLAVDWELAPAIKKEIAEICKEFEGPSGAELRTKSS